MITEVVLWIFLLPLLPSDARYDPRPRCTTTADCHRPFPRSVCIIGHCHCPIGYRAQFTSSLNNTIGCHMITCTNVTDCQVGVTTETFYEVACDGQTGRCICRSGKTKAEGTECEVVKSSEFWSWIRWTALGSLAILWIVVVIGGLLVTYWQDSEVKQTQSGSKTPGSPQKTIPTERASPKSAATSGSNDKAV